MQSLGLDIKVLTDDDKEVEIKDSSEITQAPRMYREYDEDDYEDDDFELDSDFDIDDDFEDDADFVNLEDEDAQPNFDDEIVEVSDI